MVLEFFRFQADDVVLIHIDAHPADPATEHVLLVLGIGAVDGGGEVGVSLNSSPSLRRSVDAAVPTLKTVQGVRDQVDRWRHMV